MIIDKPQIGSICELYDPTRLLEPFKAAGYCVRFNSTALLATRAR